MWQATVLKTTLACRCRPETAVDSSWSGGTRWYHVRVIRRRWWGNGILIILIFVLHYPVHMAVGTSSFIMMITAASGTLGYVLHGNINTSAALIASIPTVLCASLGALIANRVSEKTLGRIIGAVLTIMGVTMMTTQYLVA